MESEDKKEKLYRPEDVELVKRFKAIGSVEVGVALSKQERLMNEIQLEATLRNIKTSQELKKSTDVYSIVLIFLTIIVALIGSVQLVVNIEDSAHFWVGIGLFLMMFVVIWFVSRKLEGELMLRYPKNKI